MWLSNPAIIAQLGVGFWHLHLIQIIASRQIAGYILLTLWYAPLQKFVPNSPPG